MRKSVEGDNSLARTVPPSGVRDDEGGVDGLTGHIATLVPLTGRVNVNGRSWPTHIRPRALSC